jgi:hypothetical protein
MANKGRHQSHVAAAEYTHERKWHKNCHSSANKHNVEAQNAAAANATVHAAAIKKFLTFIGFCVHSRSNARELGIARF